MGETETPQFHDFGALSFLGATLGKYFAGTLLREPFPGTFCGTPSSKLLLNIREPLVASGNFFLGSLFRKKIALIRLASTRCRWLKKLDFPMILSKLKAVEAVNKSSKHSLINPLLKVGGSGLEAHGSCLKACGQEKFGVGSPRAISLEPWAMDHYIIDNRSIISMSTFRDFKVPKYRSCLFQHFRFLIFEVPKIRFPRNDVVFLESLKIILQKTREPNSIIMVSGTWWHSQ